MIGCLLLKVQCHICHTMHIQDKFNTIKELHKMMEGWQNPGNDFLLALEKNGKLVMDQVLYLL